MEFLNGLVLDVGLSNLWDYLLKNWITYAYIGAVAFFAFTFFKDRAWSKLIGFVGIAAIIGVLIFGGKTLFAGTDGNGGTLTNVGKDAAGKIKVNSADTITGLTGSNSDSFDSRFK